MRQLIAGIAAAAAALTLIAGLPGGSAAAAEPPVTTHGMADTYAAPGVALAWGVLRDPAGAGGDAATVVIRVMADPGRYPVLSAEGVDPFTQAREPRLAATRVEAGRGVDLRVPRARFADFPRTELMLYASGAVPPSGAPALVVYFLGVPDTTPEFATAAALDAHLAERIARLRASTGTGSP